jgi:putative hydrolase of the HAD superfamily
LADFYLHWSTAGKKYFTRFLEGELTFEQQKAKLLMEVFIQGGVMLSEAEAAGHFAVYLRHFENNWTLYDDVLPCLNGLNGRDLGIITNGDAVQQRQKLKKLGIMSYFKIIVTASDIGIAKPNPMIFQRACEMAGKRPQDCCYIGDDLQTDIIPSSQALLRGIWLNRNSKSQGEESGFPAICSLKELKELLNQ